MSAVGVSYNDKFLVFGGWLRRYASYSDVWAFSFITKSWRQLHVKGENLPSLAGASATLMSNNEILIFGGVYQYLNGTPIFYNSLYTFDPSNNFISIKTPVSASPPPREMHIAVSNGDDLYGSIWQRRPEIRGSDIVNIYLLIAFSFS